METLRKRKAAVYQLIDKQREQLKEAAKHLIWKRRSEESIRYDVVVTFPPKGFHVMEPLLKIINDRLPQLVVAMKAHLKHDRQAFYITANTECLLETASLMGLDMGAEGQTLSCQQRQTLIRHYLNSLRWFKPKDPSQQVQLPTVKLVEGEAIIAKLVKLNIIDKILPLHAEQELEKLRQSWVYSFFKSQPLDEICTYFGAKIGMYFAFLGYYTWALTIPAALGILITILGNKPIMRDACIVLFSTINIVWAAFYLEFLKSYCSRQAKSWGTLESDMSSLAIRPQFRGKLLANADTKEVQLFYPEWKRKLIQYFVSLPIIAASLLLVFITMFQSLRFQTWWDNVLIAQRSYPAWTSYLPKVALGFVINIMDLIYYRIAVWLNLKENYQYEEIHENHLINKLVLFQFVNSFLSLFYIAFYLGDMEKLHEQLAALLITRQVIGNLKEAFWPLFSQWYQLSPTISQSDLKISQEELESNLYFYESTFDDYLEMFIQFGYVTLFSSTFPLAATCALINNIIEIRSDAFKMCVTHQRPFAGGKVKNIGEWHRAMNAMVYVAIVVNSALIVKSGQLERLLPFEGLDTVQVILVGVVLEHIMLALKMVIERGSVLPFFGSLNSIDNEESIETLNGSQSNHIQEVEEENGHEMDDQRQRSKDD